MVCRVFRYLLVVVLSLSSAMGVGLGAFAQESTTKVTELTQRTIAFDQSWSEMSSNSDPGTGLESVILEHVDGGRVGFIFSNSTLDQSQARDATLEGTKSEADEYTVIDSGAYDNVAYELAHYKVSGEKVGIFVLVVNSASGTTIVMVTGEVESFKDAVGRVQAGVTLDGAPVLQGIDGSSLQTQLQVTGASDVTTSAQLPRENANVQPTSVPSTNTGSAQSEFTSSAYGYTITYSSPWEPSGQGIGEFDLGTYSPLVLVGFQGIENAGLSGYDFEFALADTFEENLGSGGQLIGTYSTERSAVFIGISNGMVLIQEVIAVSPTVAVIVTAVAEGSADPDTVIANLRTIRIDGVPLISPMS